MADTSDPFQPAEDHAQLLQHARELARVEAVRHAEDLLDRDLPYVGEAEQVGLQRMALLTAARAERVAACEVDEAAALRAAESAERQRDAALDALRAAGVMEEQLALSALDLPISHRTALSVAAGAAALAVVVALVLGWSLAGVVVLAVAAAAAGFAAVQTSRPAPVELPRLTALRRERSRAEAAALAARRAADAATLELRSVREQADALALGEQAFARELVAGYLTELHSSFPPGVLADGGRLTVQREVEVPLPDWHVAAG